MTITDRIEKVAPWGFIRAKPDSGLARQVGSTWRVLPQSPWPGTRNDAERHAEAERLGFDYLTPAQAAAALEDCEQCHGSGVVARTEMVVGFPTPLKAHCPSCASLRACVEALLR